MPQNFIIMLYAILGLQDFCVECVLLCCQCYLLGTEGHTQKAYVTCMMKKQRLTIQVAMLYQNLAT